MIALPHIKTDEVITPASTRDEEQGFISESNESDENDNNDDGKDGNNDDKEEESKLKKQAKKTTITTMVVGVLVVSHFGMQIAAMAITGPINILVILSGITGLVLGTTTGYKQYLLQSMESLRVVHNKIRKEVNMFKLENEALTENVDTLESDVKKLVELEGQLKVVAEQHGYTAEKLKHLVKENRETIDEQKKIVKSNFQQQLLRAVLGSDRDGDFNIDEREARGLVIQMRNTKTEFDEDWLMQSLLSTGGDVSSLLRLIREYEPV